MTVQVQDSTMRRPAQPWAGAATTRWSGPTTSASTTGSTRTWTWTGQPDPARTLQQWHGAGRGDRDAGGRVDVLEQRAGLARHGLRDEPRLARRRRASGREPGRDVPHAVRRAAPRGRDLARRGSPAPASPRRTSDATASVRTSRPATPSRTAVGWSSATARAPRSSRSSTWPPSSTSRSSGVQITHPGMYHLDLAFCPLDEHRAMVCPAAFDAAGARRPARPGARADRAHRGRRR